MLGTGLSVIFYTHSIHGQRNRDRVLIVYSRDESRGRLFAGKHNIPKWSASMKEAVSDPEVDLVVVGLPNNLHLDAVKLAAEAGKAIFCTKPLGRNATRHSKCLTWWRLQE
jgi:predicted dehydrogenase